MFNCKGFHADVMPSNGYYKSKVHKIIGIPKWMSMKKEIRLLKKEYLPCLNIKAKFNSEKDIKCFSFLFIIKSEPTNTSNKDYQYNIW